MRSISVAKLASVFKTIARKSSLLAAFADQAWLSVLSLAISLVFVWDQPKAEYAKYILLLTPLALIQGLQNAAINSPFLTLYPAATDSARWRIQQTASTLQLIFGVTFAFAGLGGLYVYWQLSNQHADPMLAAGFSVAIGGLVAREAHRSRSFAGGLALQALYGDLAYGALLLIGLGVLLWLSKFSTSSVLLITGVAALMASLLRGKFVVEKLDAESIQRFWSCARWAIPSVVASWLSLGTYPYFAGTSIGLHAVADLGAARLLVMPAALLITAWGNWYRPKFAQWLARGDTRSVEGVIYKSSLAVVLGLLVALLLTVLIYPFFDGVLPNGYRGLRSLVMAWFVYCGVSFIRNIFMAALMCDANGFRMLHHITWLGLCASVLGLAVLCRFGTHWVVGTLCAIEAVQLALIVRSYRLEMRIKKADVSSLAYTS